MSDRYETVIGLEVHVQLATRTKAFCGCSTKFGAEPNSQVCPVCLGLPGVLPVLNKKAFEYAVKVAFALDCDVQRTVKFDRKNYYYPDLPKNYQISQYDMPVAYNGSITLEGADGGQVVIGVTRAHLEEDAGKLIHGTDEPYSYVDLNRTGTPLLEIVSEPDLRSPEQAYQYLVTLKQIIKYLDVSDCNMEEGSLRCDANISIREKGTEKLGSKVEIKNLNSFKAVRDALAYEEIRQAEALDDGGKIVQETRLWDENKNITVSMRTKEYAQDYRYFPDPDLVPFEVSGDLLEEIRAFMPELPASKKKRFAETYGLVDQDLELMVSERDIAEFFEGVARALGDAKTACNWIKGEVLMHARERGTDVPGLGLSPVMLASIIKMEKSGKISGLAAKEVLKAHLDTGKSPDDIVGEKGLEQVSDRSELEAVIDTVISENERSVNDFKNGKENALSFLVGQTMKKTKGKANPKLVGEMLREKLS
ncbi:MAG: Asp-tRNA(Asn)/Glu-tRNA(Gln) amidotransferase subunit GatB [Candidatus Omnitrophica bacterium]|nr:Asp-tRNA(Asn)/Glu-tRNA(Gln) amidotransferase subunit GatB [Candidatus Omnitrophota bacterium]MDD5488405.1 Asp-tRNA(Asn)/Glu-tRNA(Gln) amidotransferase subunit GatB [Candidatus Omnitrophota bacterium]